MNHDEKVGVIAGLCLFAALDPSLEPTLKELAFALHQQWGFGDAENERHERLCAELAQEAPRRGGDA